MRLEDIDKLSELAKELRELKRIEKNECGRWGHWGINDRTSSEHFAFLMNYGNNASHINIPTRYNDRFIKLVKEIISEIEKEISNYGA